MNENTGASSLVDFVKAIALCRRSMNSISGEETPPISMESTLVELAAARGLEQFYVPFDKINYTHKYKGKLGFCYQAAYRLAESDSIFIYCEGYAASEKLSIPLAHAWCVNRETREVYDPVWNTKKTRGNAYCGLPMNLDFVIDVMSHSKVYGVIDCLWQCKHLFNARLGDIVHPDYKDIIL